MSGGYISSDAAGRFLVRFSMKGTRIKFGGRGETEVCFGSIIKDGQMHDGL